MTGRQVPAIDIGTSTAQLNGWVPHSSVTATDPATAPLVMKTELAREIGG